MRTRAETEASIEYWQAQGPTRIWEAAWQMVVDDAKARGIGEDQLKLRRDVERIVRAEQRPLDRPEAT